MVAVSIDKQDTNLVVTEDDGTVVALSPTSNKININADESANLIINQPLENSVIVAPAIVSPIEINSVGPQGPIGNTGPQGPPGQSGVLANESARVDGSIIYYDLASNEYKADATLTKINASNDGGNF